MEVPNSSNTPTGLLAMLWERFGSCDYSHLGDDASTPMIDAAPVDGTAGAVRHEEVSPTTQDGSRQGQTELENVGVMTALSEHPSDETTLGDGTAAPTGKGGQCP
jgi:hypothetical protein